MDNKMIQFPSGKTKKEFDAGSFKEMNVLGDRITQARKQLRLSQKELSELLRKYNISVNVQTISKWEKGAYYPKPDQLFALCYGLGIDNPLLYFTGSSPEPADYSTQLNQTGLDLLQLMKDALISSGRYAPKPKRIPCINTDVEIAMKVYDEPAAAGPGTSDVEGSYEMIDYPENLIPDGTDFGIRVSGISMLPRYCDRQIVWVENVSEIHHGEIGVFFYDGKAYIKKYMEEIPSQDEIPEYTDENGRVYPKVTLYSLNRDCADLDVHVKLGHSFSVIGRVLN